jgi:hypothetical protein
VCGYKTIEMYNQLIRNKSQRRVSVLQINENVSHLKGINMAGNFKTECVIFLTHLQRHTSQIFMKT